MHASQQQPPSQGYPGPSTSFLWAVPGMGQKKKKSTHWFGKTVSENALALCGNRYKPHFYAVFYILVVFENVLIFGNIKINNGICGI